MALACLATPISTATAQTDTGSGHIISLQQADIRAFIDDVSTVTGYTFLVDPRVQGQVTISSSDALTKREVFDVFKNVLRNQGYTLVRTGAGEYRVTLLQGAAQDAPFVERSGATGTMATVVIPLRGIEPTEAAKVIKPVLHSQGVLSASPGTNILVITDFPENLNKAREIVAAMEAETSTMQTIQLRNMSAIDAEEALKALQGATPKVVAVGVPATNSIVLQGEPAEVFRFKELIASLDASTLAPRGAISVVPVRYGDGERIAEVIGQLLPGIATEGERIPSIAYEPGSNSLVINASGDIQNEIAEIVRRLDQRRPQVMVEAMIVEISDTAAKELGVEFALSGLNGNDIPFIGTNFSRQSGNVLALAGAVAGDRIGIDTAELETAAVNSLFGLEGGIGAGVTVGGNTLFAVIVNAIERDTESNILSNPFFTTVDNVPATFLVGQEIPVTTGESFGQAGGLQNPFRSFERQDVGLKLEVLPQITEGEVIRLEIKNEVSSIAGVTSSGAGEFILNKRELETTVLAESGEIIVLGGLIQDDEQLEIDKVPILGDAPLIGNLFRSKGKDRSRTNLMVFLRPRILRSGEEAKPYTDYRLNQMRAIDQSQSGREVSKFDQLVRDVPE
jgi:general secretion pathway protein D